jgi:hypothetical protein
MEMNSFAINHLFIYFMAVEWTSMDKINKIDSCKDALTLTFEHLPQLKHLFLSEERQSVQFCTLGVPLSG